MSCRHVQTRHIISGVEDIIATFAPDSAKALAEVKKGLQSTSVSAQSILLMPDQSALQRRRDFKMKCGPGAEAEELMP